MDYLQRKIETYAKIGNHWTLKTAVGKKQKSPCGPDPTILA